MAAADLGQDGAVAALIAAGADVNAQSRFGRSALMAAASNGSDSTVRLLLIAGADRAARDRSGATAADQAAQSGHTTTARLLAPGVTRLSENTDPRLDTRNWKTVQVQFDGGKKAAAGSGTTPIPPVDARITSQG
jgi:ankyrin repeat protein